MGVSLHLKCHIPVILAPELGVIKASVHLPSVNLHSESFDQIFHIGMHDRGLNFSPPPPPELECKCIYTPKYMQ